MTASTGCARAASSARSKDGEADAERVERVVLPRCRARRRRRLVAVRGARRCSRASKQRELVDCGVPERHLRLDADDVNDTEAGCDVDSVVDQRRLADARRTTEQERTGGAPLGVSEEQFVDRGPFGDAADEEVVACVACPGSCTLVTTPRPAAAAGRLRRRTADARNVFGLDSNTSGGSITTLSPSIPSRDGAAGVDTKRRRRPLRQPTRRRTRDRDHA